MTREKSAAAGRGYRVAWVLGGAAVLGLGLGVGLSLRNQAEMEREMALMEARSESTGPMWRPPSERDEEVDPHATPEPLAKWLPDYPGEQIRSVAPTSSTVGVPMDLGFFTTTDGPDEVETFYRAFFQMQGKDVVTHTYPAGSRYVAFLASKVADGGPDDDVLRMISIIPNGSQTVVLASNTRPLSIVGAAGPQLPPGVVLPKAARFPQVFDVGEVQGARLTVVSEVPGGDLKASEAFYRDHFKAGGWVVTDDPSVEGTGTSMTAQRKSEFQSVNLALRGDKVSVVITVVRGD